MTHPLAHAARILASGRLAFLDDRGRATLATCSWHVLVPSGHPEPDSPADLYREVPCGAPVFAPEGYAPDGDIDFQVCANGHEHARYGSPAQIAEERLEALVEVAASHNSSIAARLDAGESWREVVAR